MVLEEAYDELIIFDATVEIVQEIYERILGGMGFAKRKRSLIRHRTIDLVKKLTGKKIIKTLQKMQFSKAAQSGFCSLQSKAASKNE